MQSPCLDPCKSLVSSKPQQFQLLRVRLHRCFHVSCRLNGSSAGGGNGGVGSGSGERVKLKGKENVWSIDNEKANQNRLEKKRREGKRRRQRGRGRGGGTTMDNFTKRRRDYKVMVSGSMLMEVETVLQTQEPVIRPVWNTFASSVSGIWKGVGAVFSPFTAEMEPVEIGNRNENLYDCYTLSRIEAVPSPSGGLTSQIQRKINWATLNPHGETEQVIITKNHSTERKTIESNLLKKDISDRNLKGHTLPKFESFDFLKTDLMEEDIMSMEPGLVFFEDGSYSRGPIEIPIGEANDSEYYLCPTFKFEQCLVKGCHIRLRIIHTIEFGNGGSDIQILRVAVYEEHWASPANIPHESDQELDLKPFSQRKRVQPLELTGSWKVFEMSATPIFDDGVLDEETDGNFYVYLCNETIKKRTLPENPVHFGEEDMLDMQDATVLWLPGGVTRYVDVDKDGIICIGVGWYSEEGINLVMERDYGVDGKLKEVRYKSEVKRRWSDLIPR